MTHYETLGKPETASNNHVKDSYRLLAMAFHPDRLSGLSEAMRQQAEERRKGINAAHQVIGNPVRRANYDAELSAQRGSWRPPTPPPEPEPQPGVMW
jgi:curved DNA-binding protein CbpA